MLVLAKPQAEMRSTPEKVFQSYSCQVLGAVRSLLEQVLLPLRFDRSAHYAESFQAFGLSAPLRLHTKREALRLSAPLLDVRRRHRLEFVPFVWVRETGTRHNPLQPHPYLYTAARNQRTNVAVDLGLRVCGS
jgi:hypothetical protein